MFKKNGIVLITITASLIAQTISLSAMESSSSSTPPPDHSVILLISNIHEKDEAQRAFENIVGKTLKTHITQNNNNAKKPRIAFHSFVIQEDCSTEKYSKKKVIIASQLAKTVLGNKYYDFTPVHLVVFDQDSLDIAAITSQMLKGGGKLSFNNEGKPQKGTAKQLNKCFAKEVGQTTKSKDGNHNAENGLRAELGEWHKLTAKRRLELQGEDTRIHTITERPRQYPSLCGRAREIMDGEDGEGVEKHFFITAIHIIDSKTTADANLSATFIIDQTSVGIINHYAPASDAEQTMVQEINYDGKETTYVIPTQQSEEKPSKASKLSSCCSSCVKSTKDFVSDPKVQAMAAHVAALIVTTTIQFAPLIIAAI